MNAPRPYPGFWQAALLCVVFVAVQSALVMPFVVAQMVLKVRLIDHPAVIAVINPLACGLTLLVGHFIGRQSLRQALPIGSVPVALLGCAVLTLTGAVILLSEADTCFAHCCRCRNGF